MYLSSRCFRVVGGLAVYIRTEYNCALGLQSTNISFCNWKRLKKNGLTIFDGVLQSGSKRGWQLNGYL